MNEQTSMTSAEQHQVVAVDRPQQKDTLSMILRAATDPTCDVEKMERLLAMHERMQAKQAEIEYDSAMSVAQAQMPRIVANANNRQTSSTYAKIDQIDRAIRPIYTAHGFSVSFDSAPSADPGCVDVIAEVKHVGGHGKTYRLPVPNDGKGAKGGDVMTRTHAQIAAVTYGRSALLKMVFNLAIGNDPDDDDGNGAVGKAGYDCTAWLDAIRACVDESGLKDLADDLRGSIGIPGPAMKKIRQAWAARMGAVKANPNA